MIEEIFPRPKRRTTTPTTTIQCVTDSPHISLLHGSTHMKYAAIILISGAVLVVTAAFAVRHSDCHAVQSIHIGGMLVAGC
jgi:hypothetical protein